MLSPKYFYEYLKSKDIVFFTGVPDSLLKSFCGYIADHSNEGSHVIATNEGGAVSLGIGYHLATGKTPLIYMQNSGLGNAINPLLSLADKEIFGIPMIVLIGWRGEPGTKDEPQHLKQGKVLLPMIESMELPYKVLTGDMNQDQKTITTLIYDVENNKTPGFLIAKRDVFSAYDYTPICHSEEKKLTKNREQIIQDVLASLPPKSLVVATAGMASREIFEYRKKNGESYGFDFLAVGGMGHASQIALGLSTQSEIKNIICIDGDGAALMHLGALVISGQIASKNYKHIVINNGSHDSVGGQPTLAFDIDLNALAKSVGFNVVKHDGLDIASAIRQLICADGPAFLELKARRGSRKDLGRPTKSPKDNKELFMQNFLRV